MEQEEKGTYEKACERLGDWKDAPFYTYTMSTEELYTYIHAKEIYAQCFETEALEEGTNKHDAIMARYRITCDWLRVVDASTMLINDLVHITTWCIRLTTHHITMYCRKQIRRLARQSGSTVA